MRKSAQRLRQIAEKARYMYRSGGIPGILFCMLYKVINRFTRLQVIRVFMAEPHAVNTHHLHRLDDYRFDLLTADELWPYVDDPENDLSREFLEYARRKGDKCSAVFEGDKLVNYCWNSEKPTLLEDDLNVEFPSGYHYRYKEFTRASHRGRRLGPYSSAEALVRLSSSSNKGFIGCVEANNFISYRAQKRKNYSFPGSVIIFGKGPEPWIWLSPGARRCGFRVVGAQASPAREYLASQELLPNLTEA